MFKKENPMEKRLRKIWKGEQENIKLLEKQLHQLEKALEDNEKVLNSKINDVSPQESKLEKEATKLKEKLEKVTLDLEKFKEKRERSAEPYRERNEELRERLEIVRVQLTAANSSRRVRSSSTNLTANASSMLDVRFSPGENDRVRSTSTPVSPLGAFPATSTASLAFQNSPSSGPTSPSAPSSFLHTSQLAANPYFTVHEEKGSNPPSYDDAWNSLKLNEVP